MRAYKFTMLFLSLLLTGCAQTQEVVSNDFDPPYININQYEFTTTVGNKLDFSNITGYDDIDGMLPVKVEGYINYNKEGEYYPSFVCIDTSGNQTRVGITVHVVPEYEPEATTEQVEAVDEAACKSDLAADPNLPCYYVLPDESSKYEYLFIGEEGQEACVVRLVDDNHLCESVYSNDGSLWGYGSREKTEEEKEESDD